MEKIRDLRKMNSKELMAFAKENRKMLEKVLLVVIVAACLIIYMAGGKDEGITLEGGDNGSGVASLEGSEDGVSTLDENGKLAGNGLAPGEIYIDVAGAVKKPGVVILSEGARIFQAIDAAGGLGQDGDTSTINLAQILEDGDRLIVPTKDQVRAELGGDSASGGNGASSGGSGGYGVQCASSKAGKINLNTASSSELQTINGIGAVTASKIIAYREANGKFKTIEDLKNVSGIGDKTFEKLKDSICV